MGSALLIQLAVVVFLFGLISEQIAAAQETEVSRLTRADAAGSWRCWPLLPLPGPRPRLAGWPTARPRRRRGPPPAPARPRSGQRCATASSRRGTRGSSRERRCSPPTGPERSIRRWRRWRCSTPSPPSSCWSSARWAPSAMLDLPLPASARRRPRRAPTSPGLCFALGPYLVGSPRRHRHGRRRARCCRWCCWRPNRT